MSTTPEGFGAVSADVGLPSETVAEPAITSESLPDTDVQAEATETTETPEATGEPEPTRPGPVPYERFQEVIRQKQALEAEQQTTAQLRQLYALAETDPILAAEGFEALSASLRRSRQGGPDLDSMTDTERALYTELQQVKQEVAEGRQSAHIAQDSIARRELTDAMSVLEREAKEKGWPFDMDAVTDAMDDLNLEKMVKAGKSMEDMARQAYKVAHFDKMPDAVRKQTYASQQKKAGANLAPATSKGGEPTHKINSVADAAEVWFKKHGL